MFSGIFYFNKAPLAVLLSQLTKYCFGAQVRDNLIGVYIPSLHHRTVKSTTEWANMQLQSTTTNSLILIIPISWEIAYSLFKAIFDSAACKLTRTDCMQRYQIWL